MTDGRGGRLSFTGLSGGLFTGDGNPVGARLGREENRREVESSGRGPEVRVTDW